VGQQFCEAYLNQIQGAARMTRSQMIKFFIWRIAILALFITCAVIGDHWTNVLFTGMSIATPGLTIIDLYEKRVLKNGWFETLGLFFGYTKPGDRRKVTQREPGTRSGIGSVPGFLATPPCGSADRKRRWLARGQP
jgi:hypothetical protein